MQGSHDLSDGNTAGNKTVGLQSSLDHQSHNSNLNKPSHGGSVEDGPGSGDESDPARLGSFDYHHFLGGTSGHKAHFNMSFIAATSPPPAPASTLKPSGGGLDIDAGQTTTPPTAIKAAHKHMRAVSVETPTHHPKKL